MCNVAYSLFIGLHLFVNILSLFLSIPPCCSPLNIFSRPIGNQTLNRTKISSKPTIKTPNHSNNKNQMKLLRIYLYNFPLNNREIQQKISSEIISNHWNLSLALPLHPSLSKLLPQTPSTPSPSLPHHNFNFKLPSRHYRSFAIVPWGSRLGMLEHVHPKTTGAIAKLAHSLCLSRLKSPPSINHTDSGSWVWVGKVDLVRDGDGRGRERK